MNKATQCPLEATYSCFLCLDCARHGMAIILRQYNREHPRTHTRCPMAAPQVPRNPKSEAPHIWLVGFHLLSTAPAKLNTQTHTHANQTHTLNGIKSISRFANYYYPNSVNLHRRGGSRSPCLHHTCSTFVLHTNCMCAASRHSILLNGLPQYLLASTRACGTRSGQISARPFSSHPHTYTSSIHSHTHTHT